MGFSSRAGDPLQEDKFPKLKIFLQVVLQQVTNTHVFFISLGVIKPFPHIIAKGKMLSGFRIDQQHFMEPTLF